MAAQLILGFCTTDHHRLCHGSVATPRGGVPCDCPCHTSPGLPTGSSDPYARPITPIKEPDMQEDRVTKDQLHSRLAGYHVGDRVAIAVGQSWYFGRVSKLTKTKVHVDFTKGSGEPYTKAVDPYTYAVPSMKAQERATFADQHVGNSTLGSITEQQAQTPKPPRAYAGPYGSPLQLVQAFGLRLVESVYSEAVRQGLPFAGFSADQIRGAR